MSLLHKTELGSSNFCKTYPEQVYYRNIFLQNEDYQKKLELIQTEKNSNIIFSMCLYSQKLRDISGNEVECALNFMIESEKTDLLSSSVQQIHNV